MRTNDIPMLEQFVREELICTYPDYMNRYLMLFQQYPERTYMVSVLMGDKYRVYPAYIFTNALQSRTERSCALSCIYKYFRSFTCNKHGVPL